MTRLLFILTAAVVLAAGCVSKSEARRQQREAFLAGQSQAMAQVAPLQNPNATTAVVIHGPVDNDVIPWVDDLTLAQALLQANYKPERNPSRITITRGMGQIIRVDMRTFLSGNDVPLQAGDRIDVFQ